MSANERLIIKMLLEQKTELLTSAEHFRSASVGAYEFPQAEFLPRPTAAFPDAVLTQFPSDRALASAFHPDLTERVYRAAAEEARTVNPFGVYLVSDHLKEGDGLYLSASFAAEKIRGLTHGRQPACFQEEAEPSFEKRYLTDVVLGTAEPTFFFVKSLASAEKYAKEYPGILLVAMASTPEETAKYFFCGCTYVFLKEDFSAELNGYLSERTRAYRKAYEDYRKGTISLTEFDRRKRSFEIFDESILDEACSRMISALRDMKEAGEADGTSFSALSEDRTAKFDERNHRTLARIAARESIVLLKNQGGILPLGRKKVAVVGEAAEKAEYTEAFFRNRPTELRLPFEAVNDYDLNTVGFSAGYRKGETGRTDLMANAFSLSRDADCTVAFFSVAEGEKKLPPEQEELLELLFRSNVNVVAVVDSDGVPDLSFASKCKAVLLTSRGGQETADAVFEILTGETSPSGKLTETVGFTAENGQRMIAYPFGFGLTYTSFEYKNLKINKNGLSCTVVNTGNYDAYATLQFYVQKDGSEIFAEKTLRGISKVFVKKGDAARVEFAFDENTFRYYNEKKKRYCVDGGEYRLSVSENLTVEKLSGKVTLADYREKAGFENSTVEVSDGDAQFDRNEKDGGAFKEKRGISFGIKLFLAITLFIYVTAVLAVFALGLVVPIEDPILHYGVIGGVFLAALAFFITYVVLSAKHRKKPAVPVNEALTDMLDRVGEFDEIAKVSYQKPVSEEEKAAQEAEEEKAEEQKEDPKEAKEPPKAEEKPRGREAKFDEETKPSEFTDRGSFGELCADFRDYARKLGIGADLKSIRLLFSAIAASRIVILDSWERALLPDLCKILNSYFGGSGVTRAGEDWNSVEDVLWKDEGERCVPSDFVNTLYQAGKSPDRVCAAVVSGADEENFAEWFGDFIDYANAPADAYEMELDDDLVVPVPENVVYIVAPEKAGFGENISRSLANASTHIMIHLRRIDVFTDTKPTAKALSRYTLEALVSEAREEFYLSETVWKKFDTLFETVAAGGKFRFGNKNCIQTERFSSVLMECGADENEALLKVLFAKVIPVLKTTEFYRKENGDTELLSLLEKLFPDEDAANFGRAVLRRGADEGESA